MQSLSTPSIRQALFVAMVTVVSALACGSTGALAAPVTVAPEADRASLKAGLVVMRANCASTDCRLKASVSYHYASGRELKLAPVARATVCGGFEEVHNGTWPAFACRGVPLRGGSLTDLPIRLRRDAKSLRRAVASKKVNVRIQLFAQPTLEDWVQIGSGFRRSFPAPANALGPWQPAGDVVIQLRR